MSSGVEPVFAIRYQRRILEPDGQTRHETVKDYAAALFERVKPREALPDTFVTASDISVAAHVEMQAALQPHVDSSISKTINCPPEISFDAFKDVYMTAFNQGLKGCTTFRPNAVTGSVLSALPSDDAATSDTPAAVAGPVASTAPANGAARPAPVPDGPVSGRSQQPIAREDVLAGHTYKFKWPGTAHALYITINDIEHDGRRRPFEIFINTKNLEHQAWTVALTRMISAVFRRGGDVTFVVEELKAIFDPQGGQWLNGRYVPSLLAAIGDIIEEHMLRIGFLDPEDVPERPPSGLLRFDGGALDESRAQAMAPGRPCPVCGVPGLLKQEGCWVCPTCGYSHCG